MTRLSTLLVRATERAFEKHGALAATTGFSPRPAQTRIAVAVAGHIDQGGALVAEAGTGIGKTFAYLVPALLSGEKVLLSTATKALQDQLFQRDLPHVAQALGQPTRHALLKGRSSYLCLHRLGVAREQLGVANTALLANLAKVERWANLTIEGDLAELPDLDERSPVIPLVTSTRDNCLGAQCPQFQACHVNLARRRAMDADVVVINHHLFFADLSIRETGMAELLPSVRVVVFDEAHQLNEIGVQFMGRQLSSLQVLDFARDVLTAGHAHARGLVDWRVVAGNLEDVVRRWRATAPLPRATAIRLRWGDDGVPERVDATRWIGALEQLKGVLDDAMVGLRLVRDTDPDLARLLDRGSELRSAVELFLGDAASDRVRWVDVTQSLRLHEAPLDIAQTMQSVLAGAPAAVPDDAPSSVGIPDAESRRRSWIFVSATLGDDAQLRWFTEPCGLQDAEIMRVDSPFDYPHQASLYIPTDVVSPQDPRHSDDVAHLVAAAAACLGGRTMVLTTTLRALSRIADGVRARLSAQPVTVPIQVLVQGELPKRVLLARFRAAMQPGQPGCVLVGSSSFWSGVDLAGPALQLVVIDKLPFPPPSDPLVEARCQRVANAGGQPFSAYSLPATAVALKQGAGRLIRSEQDRGVLVIADNRLLTRGYGKRLLGALPPMTRLHTPAEFEAALKALGEPPIDISQ